MSNQNTDFVEDTSLNTEFANDRDLNISYSSNLVPTRASDEGVVKESPSFDFSDFDADASYDDGPNYGALELEWEEEFDWVEFEGTCEGCGCGACV